MTSLEELERYPVIRYGSPDGFFIDFIVKIGTAFTYDDLNYEIIEVEGRRIRVGRSFFAVYFGNRRYLTS